MEEEFWLAEQMILQPAESRMNWRGAFFKVRRYTIAKIYLFTHDGGQKKKICRRKSSAAQGGVINLNAPLRSSAFAGDDATNPCLPYQRLSTFNHTWQLIVTAGWRTGVLRRREGGGIEEISRPPEVPGKGKLPLGWVML